ncbi:DUF2490 domain-containing protein [uncultured Winogradskyella sp.]|uniref:DUF2490 domain-containing protein n=1 Tax=uncultured Winogradskyella sp. TaxID=395353 RepID=UPI00260DDF8E|nr:DUF2490 domain-containing protein [uncultured Winogradskyella sp.]
MKRFLILLLLLSFQLLWSQNPSEDFLGSWYTYGSNHRLSEKLSITPYGELRFYEASSNYNLAFASLRGNYHLDSKSTLGLGYAFLDIDTVFEFDNAPNIIEHRIFEQYVYKHNIGKIKFTHRGRLEQRFIELIDRNELQNRLRYKLSLRYNLNKTFFLILSDEPFVNFQDQVFHENRFYSGIGINVFKNSQIQIGYLKQNIRKSNLNRIQIGISFQTDSRKQKTNLAQR